MQNFLQVSTFLALLHLKSFGFHRIFPILMQHFLCFPLFWPHCTFFTGFFNMFGPAAPNMLGFTGFPSSDAFTGFLLFWCKISHMRTQTYANCHFVLKGTSSTRVFEMHRHSVDQWLKIFPQSLVFNLAFRHAHVRFRQADCKLSQAQHRQSGEAESATMTLGGSGERNLEVRSAFSAEGCCLILILGRYRPKGVFPKVFRAFLTHFWRDLDAFLMHFGTFLFSH